MSKIDHITEQRIKDAAKITDVLSLDLGVQLHRKKDGEWLALCPFHTDRHLGSFVVSERKNIATCFSCGRTWNAIDALMEGKGIDYPIALRHLAARYSIIVDDEPVPEVTAAKPREIAPPKEMITWNPTHMVKPYLGNQDQNPLLRYLFHLPLKSEDMQRLQHAVSRLYYIGTSTKGTTAGWTIWWQIDDQMRVRTGKLMAYKEDGHRDKSLKYSFNFVHSMLAKAGQWNADTHEYRGCLFGLHLVDVFPKAEICLVESEKSALICSAFTDPRKRLWMATAGKSALTTERLQPLIDRQRNIVLYPDYDAHEQWKVARERIDYKRISISNKVQELHTPEDGDKCDIADIMLRLVSAVEETPIEIATRRLNLTPEQAENMQYLIDKLHLTIAE